MQKLVLFAALAGAISLPAVAAPTQLSKQQLDQIVAGSNANFPPGQFPSGNPAQAPGQSNPNTVPSSH